MNYRRTAGWLETLRDLRSATGAYPAIQPDEDPGTAPRIAAGSPREEAERHG